MNSNVPQLPPPLTRRLCGVLLERIIRDRAFATRTTGLTRTTSETRIGGRRRRPRRSSRRSSRRTSRRCSPRSRRRPAPSRSPSRLLLLVRRRTAVSPMMSSSGRSGRERGLASRGVPRSVPVERDREKVLVGWRAVARDSAAAASNRCKARLPRFSASSRARSRSTPQPRPLPARLVRERDEAAARVHHRDTSALSRRRADRSVGYPRRSRRKSCANPNPSFTSDASANTAPRNASSAASDSGDSASFKASIRNTASRVAACTSATG